MSLAGRVRVRGSTVTWYRPTSWTTTADGQRKPTGWTARETGVRCLLEPLTEEQVQKVFGLVGVTRERGTVAGTRAFVVGDALKVTAGKRIGVTFRVEGVLPYDQSRRSQHSELALESTTETIP